MKPHGYVYFYQAADTTVKVGWSADPQYRLRALSSIAGHRLTVIGVMLSDKTRKEEARILRDFAEHCLEGEWFDAAVLPKIEIYRSRFLAELPETQQLIQCWLSPEAWEAFNTLAKKEGRSRANLMRYTLYKLIGLAE
jgi:predicted DNA-binding protein